MDIPDEIVLNRIKIPTEWVDNLIADHDAFGVHMPRFPKILLDKSLSKQVAGKIYFHEFVEAVIAIDDLDDIKDDEKTKTAIANRFYELFEQLLEKMEKKS